ncbi:allantoinase [Diprion similis]|uniref:allantoinase n=1 Tax=Diprion similis TaxID=362088 RepID=UPI001EF7CF8E|nr:allantoinase [Diprion similis]
MSVCENLYKKAYLSSKVVLPEEDGGVQPAIIIVSNGKIEEIIPSVDEEAINNLTNENIYLEKFGSLVIMPGIVDSHVHINEPGRTDWEGFDTATRAAAAGGITTIVDMPLNSIPPTTTLENLSIKSKEALGRVFVDVGFWGGVIPGNQKELRALIQAGVVGFKCFLCPSGVDEFPHVNLQDIELALTELQSTNSVLAFHAECELAGSLVTGTSDSHIYETFLRSRPPEMEVEAIKMVSSLCKKYGVRCHIVHLSASDALDIIQAAKAEGSHLTVETCHHYLNFCAEEVPKNATEFKCCPPIREKTNQNKLWRAIENGLIDMVVSDHSPSTAELKICGDFMTAWGGISSLQFGLPIMWTAARKRNVSLENVSRLLSQAPAKLCGLDGRKGSLRKGMDADLLIWDPEATIEIQESLILHKNKLTPYMGKELFGKVVATIIRGNTVYRDGIIQDKPIGDLLLRKENQRE